MTQPPYEPYPPQYPGGQQYGQPQYPAPPQYSPAEPYSPAPQYGGQQYPGQQYPSQDQYAQPQYPGQDQYGQQQYPGQPYQQPDYSYYPQQPAQPAGTNGWAVASLIFGIIGGVLLSVIFGIVALVQIPKRGQKGKGLAVAGLVLSALWVVGLAAVVAIALATEAERDPTGDIVGGGSVSVTDLRAGDCFNGLTDTGTVLSVDAIPCADPHDAEVFAVFSLSGSTFPGDEEVFDQAEKGCNDRLADYSQKAVEDDKIGLFVFHPTQQSWTRGDKEVTCIIGSTTEKITGSLKD